MRVDFLLPASEKMVLTLATTKTWWLTCGHKASKFFAAARKAVVTLR